MPSPTDAPAHLLIFPSWPQHSLRANITSHDLRRSNSGSISFRSSSDAQLFHTTTCTSTFSWLWARAGPRRSRASSSRHVDSRATPRQDARPRPRIFAARRLRREVSDLPQTDQASVDPGLDLALLRMALESRALTAVTSPDILELPLTRLAPSLVMIGAAGSFWSPAKVSGL